MAAVKRENIVCLVNAASPPTKQYRTADRPLRPEAGPAANLPANVFPAMQPATVQSSSQVWVCRRLTLASVVQHLPLCRRNRTAQFFAATLQTFSYEHVCNYHASASSRGITASSASCVPLRGCIPSYVCFGQHFVTVTGDYDHVLCVSIQTLRCVPLCTSTYSIDDLLY